jgi:hypothetical protein
MTPQRPHRPRRPAEVSHRPFLATSLVIAVLGGFMLAVLLPLASALEWGWGARWRELAQAHGQLQLVGFAGLFIAGMSLRLMPRFSGRPLAHAEVAPAVLALVGGGVVLRALAPLVDARALHDALSIGGAALIFGGSLAFALIVVRTLAHRDSRAEATGWFFVLGALAFAAQGALALVIAIRAADDGLRALPVGEINALIGLQLFGFVMMFIGGITTRAVTTLIGRPRSQVVARAAAVLLAGGAWTYAGVTLWSATQGESAALARTADVALLGVAAAFALAAWASGVFQSRADRVAAASRTTFMLVRSAMAWLLLAAGLLAWYAGNGLADGRALNQFEVDAVRHVLAVGVVTMLIVGMGMLIVPEFAGRRLQHPNEGWLVVGMVLALNAAVVLRAWPPLEGVDWLGTARYWPMAASGVLALAVVATFALMFLQSYREQRGGPVIPPPR